MKTKESSKIGLPPGTLVHVGEQKDFNPFIKVIIYDEHNYAETAILPSDDYSKLNVLKKLPSDGKTVWINVAGVHDIGLLGQIGTIFNIHPLILEDITSTIQRPYINITKDIISLQLKSLTFNKDDLKDDSEQISIILIRNIVLTFQENSKDTLEKIKIRLKESLGKIRAMNSEFLFYSIFDFIVDNYNKAIEDLVENIEIIEDEVYNQPNKDTIKKVHQIKKATLSYRKAISPLRDVLNVLIRNEDDIIPENLSIFYHDIFSHVINILDTLESYRDIVSGLMDLYLLQNGNKANEVMKTLTIVSTIFIPLSFLTGVFGMNFNHMPELASKLSYPLGFWAIAIVIALGMLYYFRRRKWM